jgi:hypothetical protein
MIQAKPYTWDAVFMRRATRVPTEPPNGLNLLLPEASHTTIGILS